MHVSSYAATVRAIQPIILPVFDALAFGLAESNKEHARRKLEREDDPWYYLHSVRRSALVHLQRAGGHSTAKPSTSSGSLRPGTKRRR
jgi:hypothetical protein